MLGLANIAYHVGPRSIKQVAKHLCKYQIEARGAVFERGLYLGD
jgi:hypothetical protein